MSSRFSQILRRVFSSRKHPRWRKLEAVLGVRIYDFSLFEKALRHPSVNRNHANSSLQSYERLEFLGDAVLGAVIAEYLYNKFPEEMEGFLTDMRSKLVSGDACASTARDMGLRQFIEFNPQIEKRGGYESDSVMADCFESIIGAIHRDRGITKSRRFIHEHILERVDLQELVTVNDNYKSRLQEFVQSKGWPQPEYLVTNTSGPPHDLIFAIDVHINGACLGKGQATSKKKAEQQAAHQALKFLSS